MDVKILHIEDSPGDRRLVAEYLEDFKKIRVEYVEASSLDSGLKLLGEQTFDILLLDLNLPNSLGVETMNQVDPLKICTIILSGSDDQDLALDCIKFGAQDFIHKNDLSPGLLERTIQFGLKRWHIYNQNEELKANLFFKEQQLEAINKTKNAYIVRTNVEGQYTFYNESFAETFLKEGENPIGCHSLSHIMEEDHHKTFKTVEKCFSSPGEIFTVNLRKPGIEDGVVHNTSWEFMAVQDAEGNIIEVQCTGYDITRQKEEIRSIKEKYQLSKSSIDHTSDLVILHHHDLRINFASPSAVNIIGFTNRELFKFNFLDRVHHKDLAFVKSTFEKVSKKDATETMRYRFRHALGQYVWLETRASSFFDNNSKERLIITNSNNIDRTIEIEKELEYSQERYRSLFATSPYAIVVTVMSSGLVLEVNQALTNISGFTQQQLRGKSFNLLGIWKKQTDKLEFINRLKQERYIDNYNADFRLADGTTHQCILSASIAYINGQECIVNFIQDIHEQVELKNKVVEQEKRYKDLIDSVEDVIFELDMKGEMTFVSTQIQRYGYTEEEFINLAPQAYIHPVDLNYYQSLFENALNEDKSIHSRPYQFKTKDGGYVWHQSDGAARMDSNGTISGIVCIARDVTQDLKREKELEIAHDKATGLQYNLESQKFALDQHAIVSIANKKGEITYANKMFCDISGFNAGELLGQDHRILNSGYHSKNFFKELWRTISRGKVWKGEVKNKAKDGSFYWVQTSIVPRKDEKGKIVEYISMRTDITARKQAELQLEEREARLSSLINSVNQEIFAIDTNYRVLVGNDNWLRNFKQFFGKDIHIGDKLVDEQGMSEEFFSPWREQYQKVFKGEYFESKEKYVFPGDVERYVNVKLSPYRNHKNEIRGAVVYNEDVTQLTLAQQEEEYQKELMAHLVNTTGHLINVTTESELHQLLAKSVRSIFDALNCMAISVSYDTENRKYGRFCFDGPEDLIKKFPFLNIASDQDSSFDTIPESLFAAQKQTTLFKIKGINQLSENHFTEESRTLFQDLYPNIEIYTIGYQLDKQVQGALFFGLIQSDHRVEKAKSIIETIASQSSTVLAALRSKEKLQITTTQLSQAQELASLGYWEWDVVKDHVTWSDTMWEIYELDRKIKALDLDGHAKLYSKESFDILSELVNRSLIYHEPYDIKLTVLTAKGEKYIRAYGAPEILNDQVVKLKGYVQDITELEKSRLREQERLQNIRVLANSAFKLLNVSTRESLYQTAVESFKLLANKDAIMLFNLYSEDLSEFSTDYMHFPDAMKAEIQLDDFQFKDIWVPTNPVFVNELSTNEFVYVEHPNFTSINAIIPNFKQKVEQNFSPYEFYVFGILYNENLFGSIDIIIPDKIKSDQKDILLSLVSQISSSFAQLNSNERILESETRLQLAIEASQAGIYEVDLNTEHYFYDKRFAEMLGYKMEDFANLGYEVISKLTHPVDVSLIMADVLSSDGPKKKHSTYQHEIRMQHRDGHYVWIQDSGIVLEWHKDLDSPSKFVGILIDQTKRKEREEQLLLFESVITNAKDAVLITDNQLSSPGPHIIYANTAFEKMSGYTLQEVLGKSPRILQGPGTSKDTTDVIRTALQNNEVVSVEIVNYTKSGEPYWVDMNISPVFNQVNEVSHFIAIERDITQQKESRNKLREALTRLELATRTSKIGIWEYKPQSNDLVWDVSMFELYEMNPKDFTSHVDAWEESLHPEDRQNAENELALAMSGDKEFDTRFRIKTPEGQIKYISAIAHTEFTDGRATRVVGLNWDVTEQVTRQIEIENALNEREEILNSMSDGFFEVDHNWNITYWSKSASEIMGAQKEEVLNKNLWELYADALDTNFFREYHIAMETGKQRKAVDFHIGSKKWLEATAYPKEDGLAIFFRDITHEHDYQEELERLKQNREALVNTTDDFIWSVDSEMNLISANDAFIKRFKKLTGHNITEGDYILQKELKASYLERWKELYKSALKGEEVKELIENDSYDDERVLSISLYPIQDADHNVTGVACYSRDVSERFKYLKALESQNEHLKDIAWKQSHLVRAPLANIMGVINLFDFEDMSETLDQETLDLMEIMRESTTKLDDIIHDITKRTQEAKW